MSTGDYRTPKDSAKEIRKYWERMDRALKAMSEGNPSLAACHYSEARSHWYAIPFDERPQDPFQQLFNAAKEIVSNRESIKNS